MRRSFRNPDRFGGMGEAARVKEHALSARAFFEDAGKTDGDVDLKLALRNSRPDAHHQETAVGALIPRAAGLIEVRTGQAERLRCADVEGIVLDGHGHNTLSVVVEEFGAIP